MGDKFSPKTKDVIGRRVGYRCCHPECDRLTIGPTEESTKAFNTGVAAHITAASPSGARYDPTLTPEQRKHPDNGIWMCQTHGKQVDDDPVHYTVDLLKTWKREAEARTKRLLGTAVKADGTPSHFADLSSAERFGLKPVVTLADGTELPFANTYPMSRMDLDTILGLPFLVYRFLIGKCADVPNIMLYELRAVVYGFTELPPNYVKRCYAYPQTVFPYIVELETPSEGRPRPCVVTLYLPPREAKPTPFSPLVIAEDVPQVIDVRLFAPASGVYTFALEAVIVCGVERHTFRVLDPTAVLFEKLD